MASDNIGAFVNELIQSPEHKASLTMRAQLMFAIVGHLKHNKIRKSRIPAAWKLDEAEYNDLIDARVDVFTLEDLVAIAANAGIRVTLKMKPRRRRAVVRTTSQTKAKRTQKHP